jgi:hypothetical protein
LRTCMPQPYSSTFNLYLLFHPCLSVLFLEFIRNLRLIVMSDSEPSHMAIPWKVISELDEDALPTYVYERLRNPREIRLIRINPKSYHEPVDCAIFHTNISCRPKFEAISYTWADASGDKALCKRVKVNSQHYIYVTASCEAALKRVRLSHKERCIWIDAICMSLPLV